MAVQILTPILCTPAVTGGIVAPTAGLTVITGGNTVQFANVPGQTLLYISAGTTGGTIQLNVGATIFGQSFAAFTAITLSTSTIYVFGPFHSALDTPGTTTVNVVTSGALVSSMAALQLQGVY
jgi:hypothetical protein